MGNDISNISRNDVANAVLDNDATYIEEVLTGLRLPEKVRPTPEDQEVIATILGFTSNMARHDKLSRELAEVVIKHATIAIDEIQFITLVVGGSLELSIESLKSLVDRYISDSAAIPRYVYDKGIIPPDVMFAYMGLCLIRTDRRRRIENVEEVVKALS